MPILLTVFQKWRQLTSLMSMAIRGIGANKTLARLKKMGLGIRRTTGLDWYRRYASLPAKEAVIKYVPKRALIGKHQYIEAPRVMTRRNRYTVSSEFRIKATGELKLFNTSMISDRPMTVGEVEAAGGDVLKRLAGMYDATITKEWIHKAEHREGDEWD